MTLTAQHYALLHTASALTDEVIQARGYTSLDHPDEVRDLGFSKTQARTAPVLAIPLWDVHRQQTSWQIRPDSPRQMKDGKIFKYEAMKGGRLQLDVHPSVQPLLGDPHVPLWITEGVRKGDALVSAGACAIALSGVWGFRGTNAHGGKVILPDWEHVALNGRTVIVAYDSDLANKRNVDLAMKALWTFLRSRQAIPACVRWPDAYQQKKWGVDDFLAAGKTLHDLLAMIPEVGPLPQVVLGVDACPYENTPAGIVRHTQRDKDRVTTRLTNFTAAIVADVLEDDGVEQRLFFELGTRLDGQAQTFKIPASQFAGMNWVTEHMGGSAIIMPGMGLKDHARAAIQMLSPGIASHHIYTHIGWRQLDTGWAYLHAGGAVGAEGLLADVAVEPGNALAPFVLHVPETPDATQAALLVSMQMLTVAPPHIVVPLYGALWRSLLGTCDLSMHLTGDTGMGKSELAALVQQHGGKAMNAKNLPASWTSTANALEVLAFQAKDAILVIDDFCPRGSPAEVSQLHAKADRVLRAQGNRSARQRLDRTGRDRPAKPPRGLIVSTGEDIPQGQSLRARICILEVTPATVDWPRLSPCQADAAAGLYTQAMASFVQWLAPHYGNVTSTLPQELITLRAAAVQTAHRRTPELIANLALGWRYFLACAHDCGVLSAAECEQFWGWAWCTLGEVGSAQQAHQADDNPVARFLALLRGAITAGLAHVQDARTYEHPAQAQDWGWSVRDITSTRPDDASQVWTPHGACIGYLDDTRLYLEPEAAYSVVQRMAETQRAPLSLTQRTLHKRMAEQGLLTTQPSQARHTIAKRLGPSHALKRVLDIAVSSLVPLYAATTGNFGNFGNTEAQKQENQRLDMLPLPPWRSSKPVTRSTKPVTCSGAVAGSVTGSADDVTGSADDVTGFFPELSPQLIEKKYMLLKLPKLPVMADIYPPREEKSSRDESTLTDEVTI